LLDFRGFVIKEGVEKKQENKEIRGKGEEKREAKREERE